MKTRFNPLADNRVLTSKAQVRAPDRWAAGIRTVLVVLTAALLVHSPAARAQTADAAIAFGWPRALGPALESYFAGDYAAVHSYCTRVIAATADDQLRREAETLKAMALLRMPARDDRLDGRARILQLDHERPGVLDRPECLLAFGIAQAALQETASALDSLDLAARIFGQRGQKIRRAQTLAELAEAWARHAEWAATPPQFRVPRPESPQQAEQVRLGQLERLRAEIAGLAPGSDAAAAVDLLLAQAYLDTGRKARVLEVLEQWRDRAPLTPTLGRLLLRLASLYEAEGAWPAAQHLYERVRDADTGAVSRDARERLEALTQPQIKLEVPDSVRPGDAAPIRLRTRNVAELRIEIRRVDLADWLRDRRGVCNPAQLPVAGSLLLARDLAPDAGRFGWWNSEDAGDPVAFDAPSGAYVVRASAPLPSGESIDIRKLLIATSIDAACFTGRQSGAVWCVNPTPDEPAAALFWMQNVTYVPRTIELKNGVARFDLPPEARLTRQQRWTCLVRNGADLVLCQGDLARTTAVRPPRVAMVTSGAALGAQLPGSASDATVRISGIVLDPGTDSAAMPGTVALDVIDALDRPAAHLTAVVAADGAFDTECRVTEEMAGRQFHILARIGERAAEQLQGPVLFAVPAADAPNFRLDASTQPLVPADSSSLSASVQALYPWGAPVSNVVTNYIVRRAPLPESARADHETGPDVPANPGSEADELALLPLGESGLLDGRGRLDIDLPRSRVGLPPPPAALGFWFQVNSWSNRTRSDSTYALVGSQAVHSWLLVDPARPRVGEPVHFRFGWYDPQGLVTRTGDAVSISSAAGDGIASVALHPAREGFVSIPWLPQAVGRYRARAVLTLTDGSTLTAEATLEVAARAPDAPAPGEPRLAGAWLQEGGNSAVANVDWPQEPSGPMLLLAEDGEPLAVRAIAPGEMLPELALPTSNDVRLWAWNWTAEGLKRVAATTLHPAAEREFRVQLSGVPERAAPGEVLAIDVACTGSGGLPVDAAVLARVISTAGLGHVHWLPGEGREPVARAAAFDVATSATGDDASGGGGAEMPANELESDGAAFAALFEGETLWTGCAQTSEGRARLSVPVPDPLERYRLVVLARTRSGSYAVQSHLIDARQGVVLELDSPDRLRRGDRSLAAITLQNSLSDAAELSMRITPGAGLALESLQALDVQPDIAAQPNGVRRLVLSAGQRVTLLAVVEASRATEGEFVVAVEGPRLRRVARARYSVDAPPPPGDAPSEMQPNLRIRRSVYELILPPEAGPHIPQARRTGDDAQPLEFLRSPLEPGSVVPGGRLLLVRDEFVPPATWTDVEWIQDMPVSCQTINYEPVELARLGQPVGSWLNREQSTIPLIEARPQAREFCMVAVRPGSGRIPAPRVRVSGRNVAVEIDCSVERVTTAGMP